MTDRDYMNRAIDLAVKAVGHTNPNPMVGAVIVKDGEIIGEGYHERIGDLHAERNALKNCKEDPNGATIYVTLEPCCHHGKQPPCTDALIESGIKKVVIGSRDPNPQVSGKGVNILRDAGIEVVEDFMRKECDEINPVFMKYIVNKEPFVALKYAMTADGKLATDTGKSKWITGEDARNHVQYLRSYYKGILVGIGTVLADDPLLTSRMEGGRNPIRIVLDSSLRIPEESKLVKTAFDAPVIVCALKKNEAYKEFNEKKERLEEKGVKVLLFNDCDNEVDIEEMLRTLGKMDIDGILVEGGGKVNSTFLKLGKVDRVHMYIGGKIFGGTGRFTPMNGFGVNEVEDALILEEPEIELFGNDILVTYKAGV